MTAFLSENIMAQKFGDIHEDIQLSILSKNIKKN
jgi:hypothetical protein